jgi:hypothetical protein
MAVNFGQRPLPDKHRILLAPQAYDLLDVSDEATSLGRVMDP